MRIFYFYLLFHFFYFIFSAPISFSLYFLISPSLFFMFFLKPLSSIVEKFLCAYIYIHAAAAKSLQSYTTLCDPIDGSPPGSTVPGILQARTLEWVAIAFSNAWKWKVKSENEVTQSCPTLWDPTDCSLPGSFVQGIFQARVLEWVAIAFSLYIHMWQLKIWK